MPAIGWPSINAHTIAKPQHRTANHTIRYAARSFLTAVVLQRFAVFCAQFFMCPLLCLVSRPTRRHCRYSHAFFKTSLTSAACAAVSCFARHTRSRINTQTIKLVPILEFNRTVHIWRLGCSFVAFSPRKWFIIFVAVQNSYARKCMHVDMLLPSSSPLFSIMHSLWLC